ncbi:ribonuclease Y-like [Cardiocondyla obscurior]|uniref:ribonuclease Y-like n=1 Tax=Cardiocondyla obscurior TaxID=286306 RepID=UPI00396582C9
MKLFHTCVLQIKIYSKEKFYRLLAKTRLLEQQQKTIEKIKAEEKRSHWKGKELLAKTRLLEQQQKTIEKLKAEEKRSHWKGKENVTKTKNKEIEEVKQISSKKIEEETEQIMKHA